MLGAVPETMNCQRVTCTEVVVAVSKIFLPTGVSDKLDNTVPRSMMWQFCFYKLLPTSLQSCGRVERTQKLWALVLKSDRDAIGFVVKLSLAASVIHPH